MVTVTVRTENAVSQATSGKDGKYVSSFSSLIMNCGHWSS